MRNLKVWESVYNPNRFEEPLNSANDGISHNFSDLMHSGLIESFYPDNCGRPETIKRSHSEENVSSSVGKPTCSGGPQTSSASQEIPGQRRRSASQVDAFSVCSLDFPSVPQASTSSDASVINSEEQVTPSPETASDRDQQSSIGSEGDQSEPETSSSSSGTSSGTSSRNSVVHRSKKFRLRFGKEKVVDADGLTSIINFEFDNIQLMRSSYEKQILDLEAQVERLKRLCGSKEEDGDRKSKDGDEQSDATVPKTDDEFEMVNTVDSDQGAMQATLAVPEADDLHGFNFHRQFRVRRSTTGSDRSSISGCGAVAYTSDPMDQLNFEMSNCSEASNQLIPMPGSTLRRRQQSTSSTTSFNFHSSGSSGQTVHG
uniref:Cnn_1N domain-containing protein n=1 Tax=Steinernema glaseri TaxID=37863 RepID=A0A1I7ZTM4_9BILA